jgi:hypothetical protein
LSQAYRPQLRWNYACVALIRQLVPTPTTAARNPQVERVTVVQRQFSSSLYVLPSMHRGEMLLRRCLLNTVPILRTQDVSTTMLRAAMAGLCRLVIDPVPIVVGEFLACPHILDRHNPDGVPELFRVAVWGTRMIDVACRVLGRMPINGIAVVQSDDKDITCSQAPLAFLVGNFLPDIPKNFGALLDILLGKQSLSSDA